jgi:hypothetical protein
MTMIARRLEYDGRGGKRFHGIDQDQDIERRVEGFRDALMRLPVPIRYGNGRRPGHAPTNRKHASERMIKRDHLLARLSELLPKL